MRLYDRLFSVENPGTDEGKSFLDEMNPESLVRGRRARSSSRTWRRWRSRATRVQFERVGYFCLDPDSTPGKPIWNRTVGLKDSWAKIESKGRASEGASAAPPKAAKARQGAKKPSPLPPPAGDRHRRSQQGRSARRRSCKSAELVPGADKLLKLMVDLGEGRLRQIFTGLRATIPIRRCWSAGR